MFDQNSRYYKVPNLEFIAPGGFRISYKARRLPPQASAFTVQAIVTVGPADRLDTIAARALGDPEQFWRIADANDALDPFALETPGAVISIPGIKFPGQP